MRLGHERVVGLTLEEDEERLMRIAIRESAAESRRGNRLGARLWSRRGKTLPYMFGACEGNLSILCFLLHVLMGQELCVLNEANCLFFTLCYMLDSIFYSLLHT